LGGVNWIRYRATANLQHLWHATFSAHIYLIVSINEDAKSFKFVGISLEHI